jgi:hypothetical protein
MAFKNIMNGLLGNMNEVSADQLQSEYGPYLMDGETITIGFKLVRDVVIFTDKRIVSFDKQGTTGQKMRVTSIKLSTIIDVTAETAGFGVDDSEITVTYITTPFLHCNSLAEASKKFEFPKKYNIQPLYKMLEELSHANFEHINNF